MRGARGRYSFSSVYGKGVSQPVTRTTGASRERKQRSWMSAESSAPKPQVRGASCTMTARPVFFTEATMASMSSGWRERRSSTSQSIPSCSASRAAWSASCHMAPHASSVT